MFLAQNIQPLGIPFFDAAATSQIDALQSIRDGIENLNLQLTNALREKQTLQRTVYRLTKELDMLKISQKDRKQIELLGEKTINTAVDTISDKSETQTCEDHCRGYDSMSQLKDDDVFPHEGNSNAATGNESNLQNGKQIVKDNNEVYFSDVVVKSEEVSNESVTVELELAPVNRDYPYSFPLENVGQPAVSKSGKPQNAKKLSESTLSPPTQVLLEPTTNVKDYFRCAEEPEPADIEPAPGHSHDASPFLEQKLQPKETHIGNKADDGQGPKPQAIFSITGKRISDLLPTSSSHGNESQSGAFKRKMKMNRYPQVERMFRPTCEESTLPSIQLSTEKSNNGWVNDGLSDVMSSTQGEILFSRDTGALCKTTLSTTSQYGTFNNFTFSSLESRPAVSMVFTSLDAYQKQDNGSSYQVTSETDNFVVSPNEKNHLTCMMCERSFSNQTGLSVHVKTYHLGSPIECHLCGKQFSQKGNLVTHMRTHSGEKPFRCKICKKDFSHKVNLKTHMRKHSGERPYECETCGKAFYDQGNFLKHKKRHFKERGRVVFT